MPESTRRSRLKFFILLGTGCLLTLGLMQMITGLVIPAQSERVQKIIEIPPGANLRTVAGLLEREGMIRNPAFFILAGKLTGVERSIKPGDYAIHSRMPPLDILNRLKRGDIFHYEVVIPEGYTARQIAAVLGREELADPQEFLALTRDPELIHSLGIKMDSLEGYLFPSTYYIARSTEVQEIIKRMVSTFQKVYGEVIRQRSEDLRLSTHQIVTIASIIEKETSSDAERAIISGVFHNRLRQNMPLQSDPTVIYAIPNFDGNLRRVHLSIDSPYNTYRRRGLPPGPIANPGRASLEAAVNPAHVEYLFFVSRNDGTHHFSRTIEEHNQAVAQYQKSPRRNR